MRSYTVVYEVTCLLCNSEVINTGGPTYVGTLHKGTQDAARNKNQAGEHVGAGASGLVLLCCSLTAVLTLGQGHVDTRIRKLVRFELKKCRRET